MHALHTGVWQDQAEASVWLTPHRHIALQCLSSSVACMRNDRWAPENMHTDSWGAGPADDEMHELKRLQVNFCISDKDVEQQHNDTFGRVMRAVCTCMCCAWQGSSSCFAVAELPLGEMYASRLGVMRIEPTQLSTAMLLAASFVYACV